MFSPKRRRRPMGVLLLRALLVLVALCAVGHVGYVFWLQPWHVRWGADDAEVAMKLPGDSIVNRPRTITTRAITIDAPRDRVWPWLVQIGQGRGGFYSYETLENLMGCKIRNATRILPQFQDPRPGIDVVRLGPESYPSYDLAIVRAPEAFVMRGNNPGAASSWAFFLKDAPGGKTRLIVRNRGWWESGLAPSIIWGLTERVSFFMERKMLLTMKARAEGI